MTRVVNPIQSVRALTKAIDRALDEGDVEAFAAAQREADDLATHFASRAPLPMILTRKDQRAFWAAISRLLRAVKG